MFKALTPPPTERDTRLNETERVQAIMLSACGFVSPCGCSVCLCRIPVLMVWFARGPWVRKRSHCGLTYPVLSPQTQLDIVSTSSQNFPTASCSRMLKFHVLRVKISGAATRKDTDEGWMDGQTLRIEFIFKKSLSVSRTCQQSASSEETFPQHQLSPQTGAGGAGESCPPAGDLLVTLKWTFQSHRVLLKHEHVRTESSHINWFTDRQVIKNNLYIQVKLQVIDEVIL